MKKLHKFINSKSRAGSWFLKSRDQPDGHSQFTNRELEQDYYCKLKKTLPIHFQNLNLFLMSEELKEYAKFLYNNWLNY